MQRKSKKNFKMKGHTLPGINQKSETPNLPDGRSKSSAFQFGGGIMGYMEREMVEQFYQKQQQQQQQQNNPAVIPEVVTPLSSKPSMAKDMKTGKYKQKFEK